MLGGWLGQFVNGARTDAHCTRTMDRNHTGSIHKTPRPAFLKKPNAGARGRVAAHPRNTLVSQALTTSKDPLEVVTESSEVVTRSRRSCHKESPLTTSKALEVVVNKAEVGKTVFRNIEEEVLQYRSKLEEVFY